MAAKFVTYREDHKRVWLHEKPDARSAKVRDVRWGDYLNVTKEQDDWLQIKWGSKRFWIQTENTTNVRPTEVIFLDIGNGDCCLYVSSETGPKEKIMVIDAGEEDNCYNFLKWRFGKFKKRFDFHAAVITHPDRDHYYGFRRLFKQKLIGFKHIYHNGLFERTGEDLLGPSDVSGRYLTDIVETNAAAEKLYSKKSVRGGKLFPNLIHSAIKNTNIGKIQMLSTKHGKEHNKRRYVPKFSPTDGGSTEIEILGPVPESIKGTQTALRWFGSKIGSNSQSNSKTKNGHSIIFRLTVGNFKMLLGGDLNRPSEDYLLRHYSRIGKSKPLSEAVPKAKRRFACDVMKSCHHGASDVTNEFIQAVDPMAFVVSSGEESHAHPRPDLLGRLGKYGRGDAPMIFCTEILRSTREEGVQKDFTKLQKMDGEVEKLVDQVAKLEARARLTQTQKETLALLKEDLREARADRRALQGHIRRRNVGVYGAVTMRTDGERLVISWRLEKPRKKQLWQDYIMEHSESGGWQMISGGH